VDQVSEMVLGPIFNLKTIIMIFYFYSTYYAYYDYIEKLVKELRSELRSIEYKVINTLINVRLSLLKLDKRVKIYRCRNNI